MNPALSLDLAAAIETYQQMRAAAYRIARADGGAAMGDHKWLRNALDENDIEFTVTETGILCHGVTFTTQTQSNECFEFAVSTDDLLDEMAV